MPAPVGSCIDANIASLAFGWCLAIAVLASHRIYTTWFAGHRPLKIYWYFILCSGLVSISLALVVLAWLDLMMGRFPSIPEEIIMWALWSAQAQTYFQIITHRLCILDFSASNRAIMRLTVASTITLINLLVLGFWVLPKIQHRHNVAEYWMPRIEKMLYLVLDLGCNYAFVYQVRLRLVRVGLPKYQRLIHHNLLVIVASILCDALLLGMTWYPTNVFMFVIFHAVLYLNKLVLEMSICDKMAAVSRETNVLQVLMSPVREYHTVEKEASMEKVTVIVQAPPKALPRLPPQLTPISLAPLVVVQHGPPSATYTITSQLSYYALSV